MKQKKVIVFGGIAVIFLFIITGSVVFVRNLFAPVSPGQTVEVNVPEEVLPTVDDSVKVDLVKSKAKENAVNIMLSNIEGKYSSISYELTYDSNGLIKGATSGSKPVDVAGKDTFEREVYLGSCSKNVCRPDPGVNAVSLVIEFTDKEGKRSQFSKDYTL